MKMQFCFLKKKKKKFNHNRKSWRQRFRINNFRSNLSLLKHPVFKSCIEIWTNVWWNHTVRQITTCLCWESRVKTSFISALARHLTRKHLLTFYLEPSGSSFYFFLILIKRLVKIRHTEKNKEGKHFYDYVLKRGDLYRMHDFGKKKKKSIIKY